MEIAYLDDFKAFYQECNNLEDSLMNSSNNNFLLAKEMEEALENTTAAVDKRKVEIR